MYTDKDTVTVALLYLPQRADLVVSRECFPFPVLRLGLHTDVTEGSLSHDQRTL